MDLKLFGKRLDDLMYEKRITGRDLAKRLGTSEASITQYKKGTYLPQSETLNAMADILNVPVDYLLGKDVTEKPKHNVQPETPTFNDYAPETNSATHSDISNAELNIISKIPLLSDDAKRLVSSTVDALIDGQQENDKIIATYFTVLNRIRS